MNCQFRTWILFLISLLFCECKIYDIGSEAVVECKNVDLVRVQRAWFYDSRKSSSIYRMEFKMNFSKKNPSMYHLYSSRYRKEYKRYIGWVYRPNKIQLHLNNIEPLDASNFTCLIKMLNGTELSLETQIQVRDKV